MILLELAAQGVRGFAPAGGRATLRPGYNVVAADGVVLRRVLESLFYPDPKDGESLPRASAGPARAPMRAGLTAIGNDRVTYRLVRDFAAGAQLHRFDPAKRSFSLVAQDLGEIARVMQGTVGVPPPGRLDALLALSAGELPSKQDGAVNLAAAQQRSALSPAQAKKRIDLLKAELEKAKVVDKVQYRMDGLQSKLFKLEEALKAGAKIREGLDKAAAARAELGAASEIERKLGDADAKLTAYDKALARRAEAEAKIAAEREALSSADAAGPPRPFWGAPLFWAGVAGGVVLAAAGLVGASASTQLRYVALLDVPAFGWSGWLALRWVGALEEWERLARRRRTVDEWEKKVEAQFERDTSEVRDAMKAAGLSSVSELREAVARTADADAVVAEWRKRLEEWESDPDARDALAEKAKVEEALRVVEERLAADSGGHARDPRSIEAEIQRLEAEAEAPPAPPPPRAAPAPGRSAGEPLRALGERAAAALGGSPAAAVRGVAKSASQTLAGLSSQRLQAIQVDDRGNVQVQTGGRPVAAMSLAPAERDLAWLSLKLAFLEQALAAGKGVAVADDAFAGLSDGARRVAARLLKQIAKPGQILHATTDPCFREAADHAAS